MNGKTTIPIPAAFETATKRLYRRPPNVAAFWEVWRNNAGAIGVRRPVLIMLISAYPGFLKILQFGGVACIVSDGFVREFIPLTVLNSEPLDLPGIQKWLDSSVGYVSEPFRLEDETTR